MSNFTEGIGQGLAIASVLFFIAACSVVVFISWIMTDSTLRSTERIEPQIELIINNNQVDTLFVYELK